jgi:glycosyltransferase involved in cell wall biosynthesis
MVSGPAGPLVSVILPTHNRASLLPRAIASVLAQTHANLELIVVDDASSDDTPRVVGTFADPRLRYVRLEQNRRAAAARNVAIGMARGALIAFQDDDDVWLVDKLRRQVECLERADERVGLCLCAHLRIGPTSVIRVGSPDAFRDLDFRRGPLAGFGLIATPSWLARRRALEAAGLFDERLRCWDDWEFALRISQHAQFAYVDEPLFLHDRVLGGAMWRNEAAYSHDMRIILGRHGAFWQDHPRQLAALQFIVARSEARFHSVREARRWLYRALRLDPLQPKAWALLLGTLGGTATVGTMTAAWRQARGRLAR